MYPHVTTGLMHPDILNRLRYILSNHTTLQQLIRLNVDATASVCTNVRKTDKRWWQQCVCARVCVERQKKKEKKEGKQGSLTKWFVASMKHKPCVSEIQIWASHVFNGPERQWDNRRGVKMQRTDIHTERVFEARQSLNEHDLWVRVTWVFFSFLSH